jgi:Tol biopolymer transport system component
MSSDAATGRHEVLHEGRYPIRLPDVSPDGESVAFFSDRSGGMHIFVIDSDGSDLRQLTFAKGGQTLPYWSADGRSIYFFSGAPSLALQKISSEGGAATQVIANFHWSTGRTWAAERPGGESIAFVDWDLPDYSENRTVIRSLSTGAETTLSRPALLGPDWSSDGSAVLGYRLGEGLMICEAVAPESCGSISANGDAFPGTRPRWSSDESRIFFLRSAKDKPQIHDLWVVGRNGENAERLFEVGPIASSDVQFAIARNDRVIWAQYDRGDDEIWMARLRNELVD